VFENRFLKRIFGPKRDEVTGEYRKLHNEEFHNLHATPHLIRQVKSRRMRWAGYVARVGGERKRTSFWWESPKPLGRPKREWEGGIRMDLREIVWECGVASVGSR
jgi:hypothetical protein